MMVMILSCNPSKKLDKLNAKHPELLAKFCSDTFPCVITKVDTIKEIEYEFITVECPGYDVKDTIVITRDSIVKGSAIIKYEKKTNTIIKIIKDSAEIRSCKLDLMTVNKKLNESNALNIKLQNKVTGRNSAIMWLIIALLCSIIINVILIKKW
jgi:tetrahydromethanopterin S-methyltransferase subunit G